MLTRTMATTGNAVNCSSSCLLKKLPSLETLPNKTLTPYTENSPSELPLLPDSHASVISSHLSKKKRNNETCLIPNRNTEKKVLSNFSQDIIESPSSYNHNHTLTNDPFSQINSDETPILTPLLVPSSDTSPLRRYSDIENSNVPLCPGSLVRLMHDLEFYCSNESSINPVDIFQDPVKYGIQKEIPKKISYPISQINTVPSNTSQCELESSSVSASDLNSSSHISMSAISSVPEPPDSIEFLKHSVPILSNTYPNTLKNSSHKTPESSDLIKSTNLIELNSANLSKDLKKGMTGSHRKLFIIAQNSCIKKIRKLAESFPFWSFSKGENALDWHIGTILQCDSWSDLGVYIHLFKHAKYLFDNSDEHLFKHLNYQSSQTLSSLTDKDATTELLHKLDQIRSCCNISVLMKQESSNDSMDHLYTKKTSINFSNSLKQQYVSAQPYHLSDFKKLTFPTNKESFDHDLISQSSTATPSPTSATSSGASQSKRFCKEILYPSHSLSSCSLSDTDMTDNEDILPVCKQQPYCVDKSPLSHSSTVTSLTPFCTPISTQTLNETTTALSPPPPPPPILHISPTSGGPTTRFELLPGPSNVNIMPGNNQLNDSHYPYSNICSTITHDQSDTAIAAAVTLIANTLNMSVEEIHSLFSSKSTSLLSVASSDQHLNVSPVTRITSPKGLIEDKQRSINPIISHQHISQKDDCLLSSTRLYDTESHSNVSSLEHDTHHLHPSQQTPFMSSDHHQSYPLFSDHSIDGNTIQHTSSPNGLLQSSPKGKKQRPLSQLPSPTDSSYINGGTHSCISTDISVQQLQQRSMKGVSFDRSKRNWEASWLDARTGKRVKKCFSEGRWGSSARDMAILARKEAEDSGVISTRQQQPLISKHNGHSNNPRHSQHVVVNSSSLTTPLTSLTSTDNVSGLTSSSSSSSSSSPSLAHSGTFSNKNGIAVSVTSCSDDRKKLSEETSLLAPKQLESSSSIPIDHHHTMLSNEILLNQVAEHVTEHIGLEQRKYSKIIKPPHFRQLSRSKISHSHSSVISSSSPITVSTIPSMTVPILHTSLLSHPEESDTVLSTEKEYLSHNIIHNTRSDYKLHSEEDTFLQNEKKSSDEQSPIITDTTLSFGTVCSSVSLGSINGIIDSSQSQVIVPFIRHTDSECLDVFYPNDNQEHNIQDDLNSSRDCKSNGLCNDNTDNLIGQIQKTGCSSKEEQPVQICNNDSIIFTNEDSVMKDINVSPMIILKHKKKHSKQLAQCCEISSVKDITHTQQNAGQCPSETVKEIHHNDSVLPEFKDDSDINDCLNQTVHLRINRPTQKRKKNGISSGDDHRIKWIASESIDTQDLNLGHNNRSFKQTRSTVSKKKNQMVSCSSTIKYSQPKVPLMTHKEPHESPVSSDQSPRNVSVSPIADVLKIVEHFLQDQTSSYTPSSMPSSVCPLKIDRVDYIPGSIANKKKLKTDDFLIDNDLNKQDLNKLNDINHRNQCLIDSPTTQSAHYVKESSVNLTIQGNRRSPPDFRLLPLPPTISSLSTSHISSPPRSLSPTTVLQDNISSNKSSMKTIPPRVMGVFPDRCNKLWVAKWRDPISGRRQRRSFSIARYGAARAEQMAVEARLEAERIFGLTTVPSSSSSSSSILVDYQDDSLQNHHTLIKFSEDPSGLEKVGIVKE